MTIREIYQATQAGQPLEVVVKAAFGDDIEVNRWQRIMANYDPGRKPRKPRPPREKKYSKKINFAEREVKYQLAIR